MRLFQPKRWVWVTHGGMLPPHSQTPGPPRGSQPAPRQLQPRAGT